IEHARVVVGKSEFLERCFHMKRFNASTALLASLPAIFAHCIHRFINHVRRDVERGTKADRVLTRAERQHTKIKKAVPKFLTRFRIGKIESKKYSATSRGRNHRL